MEERRGEERGVDERGKVMKRELMKGKGDEKGADEKVLKGFGDFGIIIAVCVYSGRVWCRQVYGSFVNSGRMDTEEGEILMKDCLVKRSGIRHFKGFMAVRPRKYPL